jgi:hypothetical protein
VLSQNEEGRWLTRYKGKYLPEGKKGWVEWEGERKNEDAILSNTFIENIIKLCDYIELSESGK